ncbi:MAG: hypothetical protein QOD92_3244 [Acidimicrobiaceae bacterium]
MIPAARSLGSFPRLRRRSAQEPRCLPASRGEIGPNVHEPSERGPRPQPKRREPECSTNIAGADSIEHVGGGEMGLERLKLVQRRLRCSDELVVARRIGHVDDLDDRVVRERLGRPGHAHRVRPTSGRPRFDSSSYGSPPSAASAVSYRPPASRRVIEPSGHVVGLCSHTASVSISRRCKLRLVVFIGRPM